MSVLPGSFCKLSNLYRNYKFAISLRLSTTAHQYLPKLSIEEKLGIRPKPKRPASPFFKYISKIKPIILQKNPDIRITGVTKIAAAEWKKVDEKTKSELQEEYRKDYDKYKDALAKYENQLSPGDKEEIRLAKQEEVDLKEKRRLKKERESLGRPKRPPSTFVCFMKSKSSERGDLPFREWQKKVAKEWETIGEKEKEKLVQDHKAGMEEYKKKLSEWEAKTLEVELEPEGNRTAETIKTGSPPSLESSLSPNPRFDYDKEVERILYRKNIYQFVVFFISFVIIIFPSICLIGLIL